MRIDQQDLPDVFNVQFTPESWSSLSKLRHFIGPPLPDDSDVRIGLKDCAAHLEKASLLWNVAQRLRPNLLKDREELYKMGASSNVNSREFAAICESMIGSLYSAIDGLRTFLFGVYRKVRGVQRNSNGQLFARAANNSYGKEFPEELREILAEASAAWFLSFREWRTQLTHGATGSCHLNDETDKISYFNDGIRVQGKALHLEDVEAVMGDYHNNLCTLVEWIAAFHIMQLEPIPHFKICGFYKRLWYGRMVSIAPTLTFADGQCMSWDWFEKEGNQRCPIAPQCGAYQNKWPAGTSAVSASGVAE